MNLSSDLLSQFAKVTNDKKETKKETTVYGEVVTNADGELRVRLDGSEMLTPVESTMDVQVGDRVSIQLKNHTATITGNITSPAVRVGTVEEIEGKTKVYIDEVVADKIDTNQLEANTAEIKLLIAAKADIETLNATKANIETLVAKKADIETLNSTKANIETLISEKADITQLNAVSADIKDLTADVADIDTLIFGSASGTSIHSSFANAVIAQLGNAQIKSAMIESIAADKITSGEIKTNNITVKSEDGKLLISDETIQISDGTRIRVQIGKDASNDYSVNIWDANGELMFSEGGITDSAIKEAIIRNDMIADDANISAEKLDIDSLFTEINGSEKTIKSTKIYFDDEEQTLDLVFTQMTSDLDDVSENVKSQGTAIQTIQGQISSKIWEQDIQNALGGLEIDGDVKDLISKYSTLEQTVNGINATVGNHTTTIANKADKSEVKSVSDQMSSLSLTVDNFKTTVSNTYATKSSLGDYWTKTETETAINQSATDINLSVSRTYATKQSLADLEIGATNLILNSNFANGTDKWVISGVTASVEKDETHGSCLVITSSAIGSSTQRIYPSTTDNFTHTGGTYSLSFYAKTDSSSATTLQSNIAGGTSGVKNYNLTSSWQRYTNTYDASSGSITFWINEAGRTVYITKVKVEHGDKVTDWSLAQSELSTIKDLNSVKDSVSDVEADVATAISNINLLADKLEFLVQSGQNVSLLEQTADGWVFNLGTINDAVNTVSSAIKEVEENAESTEAAVESLKSIVDDIGDLTEKVNVGTYTYRNDEGELVTEPSLELYELDSNFRLLMTNTQAVFTDGVRELTTINLKGQTVENLTVRSELRQGKFVWKSRTNGNYGLMWKG